MHDAWQWSTVWQLMPRLASALWVTVLATLGGTLLALILGLILASLRGNRHRGLAWPTAWFIEFIRSTPLLVQLALVYFAILPALGMHITPLVVGIVVLGVHYACYMSEIYRSGLEAVPHGQHEAAATLGLTRGQCFVHIVIPQALPRVIPGLGNRMIAMFKETPLLSVITVPELLRVASNYTSETFRSMEAYTLVGIHFLVVSLVAMVGVRLLERHLPVRHE